MARNYKHRPLYEVIKDGRHDARDSGTVNHKLNRATSSKRQAIQWAKRPRAVQFNTGRLELSLPYPIAITAVLGVILVILVAFRLGQWHGTAFYKQTGIPGRSEGRLVGPGNLGPIPGARQSLTTQDVGIVKHSPKPAEPRATSRQGRTVTGDHIIRLVQYQRKADLVPVKEYFASHGIETEITQQGRWYFLVTKNRYQNPEKPGTDGYKVKQRIIELGAGYKAPDGYESFAPNFFRDAYGKKVQE